MSCGAHTETNDTTGNRCATRRWRALRITNTGPATAFAPARCWRHSWLPGCPRRLRIARCGRSNGLAVHPRRRAHRPLRYRQRRELARPGADARRRCRARSSRRATPAICWRSRIWAAATSRRGAARWRGRRRRDRAAGPTPAGTSPAWPRPTSSTAGRARRRRGAAVAGDGGGWSGRGDQPGLNYRSRRRERGPVLGGRSRGGLAEQAGEPPAAGLLAHHYDVGHREAACAT